MGDSKPGLHHFDHGFSLGDSSPLAVPLWAPSTRMDIALDRKLDLHLPLILQSQWKPTHDKLDNHVLLDMSLQNREQEARRSLANKGCSPGPPSASDLHVLSRSSMALHTLNCSCQARGWCGPRTAFCYPDIPLGDGPPTVTSPQLSQHYGSLGLGPDRRLVPPTAPDFPTVLQLRDKWATPNHGLKYVNTGVPPSATARLYACLVSSSRQTSF